MKSGDIPLTEAAPRIMMSGVSPGEPVDFVTATPADIPPRASATELTEKSLIASDFTWEIEPVTSLFF